MCLYPKPMPLILGSVFVLRGLRDVLEGLKVVPGGAEGSQRQMEGHLHGVLPGAWGTQSVIGLRVALHSGYPALGELTYRVAGGNRVSRGRGRKDNPP